MCVLRILHVVVNMNRGGTETLLMNLYRNLDYSRVQFDFLTCKEGIFDKEIIERGGKIHRIPYISDVGHIVYMKNSDNFFQSHPEYNIVHSHMDKMSGFVLRSAKKMGIPIRIAHSHSTDSEGGFLAKIYKEYAGRFLLSSTTHLFACSRAAATWLFAKRASEAIILKNGIECDDFLFSVETRNEVRQELQVQEDTFILGHVGRFSVPKNHTFLIDIFSKIIKLKPNSVLVLVGDGPLRIEMEKKIQRLKLQEKVRFLGSRSDVNRLLQAFDIFVFPSLYEGLPVTLIEAQGNGLPCIIADSVTQEVDMGLDLVQPLTLTNQDLWIETINNKEVRKEIKNIFRQRLAESGFDILVTAKKLQEFYLSIAR
ncbi:glycosyltransferase family 1 protein [Bacillus pacificus]|uniref:glycosyltransferase family 1 protein n=1 Tax=Bacillus pacificus TaxID=2026187 RepID=UPI003D2597B0